MGLRGKFHKRHIYESRGKYILVTKATTDKVVMCFLGTPALPADFGHPEVWSQAVPAEVVECGLKVIGCREGRQAD